MGTTLKRYWLFILTNIAIIIMINVILFLLQRFFGIDVSSGTYSGLLVFALIFGFVWALINLSISKRIAKKAYKIVLIESDVAIADPKLSVVFRTVQRLAQDHNIKVPEIGYYHASSPNAFATGPSKNNSLVAVSTWLLDNLNDKEIASVVGHEMAHVLNGDMVTMTLLQGVLNTFVIFFARVIAIAISAATKDDEGWGLSGIAYFFVVMLLDTVLSLLAALVLMAYSRHREFQADEGSARMLMDKDSMIHALQKLEHANKDVKIQQDAFATLMISWGKTWMNVLRSHPTLQQRVERLQSLQLG